ncbi:MAG TPA: hypothetical protein VFA82_09655 [Gaiellaceae bacterium]|nr:hypothetical protein [Gaiellaceae bacterium]
MVLRRRLPVVAGLVLACAAVAVAAGAVSGGGASAAASAAPSANCRLANGIQHVIEITFDNVHFNRDNPNVLSDLEQMPALTGFITGHGTLLSNNHTPLIGHTADDSITNYTGLYGDRHGQGLTNSYETYQPDGSVISKSSFAYWTGTYGTDAFPNQPYSATVPASGSPKTPPAPWVPFTRAGCDFGAVSTANMVLENVSPDLANVFGPSSPEVAQLNADPDSFKDQEVADYVGVGVHCAAGDSFCASGLSKSVTDSLPDEPGGYSGFDAVFGHKYLQPTLKGAATSGGNRVVNGRTYEVYDAAGNLVDLNGKEIDGAFLPPNTPGFPGFGPISAAQSLAYVADMQETGVPITYAYISDAHEKKTGQTGCSNSGTAQGPGDSCYKATLAAYNDAFAKFFQRLSDDGIDASNTLFVITADEGDHFAGANAGRAVAPACTGAPGTTAYTCSYAGKIGEQQVDIHGLLRHEFGDATPFYDEPQGNSLFITGNPSATDSSTRRLEREWAGAKAFDSWDNATENVAQYMADPTAEQLLHFVNADPNRTPSFTVFPKPDFFFTGGTQDTKTAVDGCASGTTADNAAANCSSVNNGFSWNHGYYAPEISNTWLGLVGPGVAHKGVDGSPAEAGPSSAGGANSDPQLVMSIPNRGTWADHTDIRPTILALTGLEDDYVDDGRVLTENLTITPGKTGDKKFEPLAVCYKQLNSSVGRFGTDVLLADTAALKTGSASDDSSYQSVLAQIKKLGGERDTLATEIKNDLFAAEFDNTPIPNGNSTEAHCQNLLRSADRLTSSG